MDSVQMIGRRIFELRMKAGETQEQTAEAVNISHVALARYENGQRMPKLDILANIAHHFGLSVDDLIGHELEATESTTDGELWALRERLRRQPGMRTLFSVTRDASEDDLRQAVAVIEALKRTSRGGDGNA